MNKKSVSTLLALTAVTTATLHILNKIQFSAKTLKGILNQSDCNYYEWRFGKIRYMKKGSGSPLLLIHDLTSGSSSFEFSRIYNELSTTNEVYAMDLLGYGLSDKPNMTYTNYLYVQLIVDFIKIVIGKKANVVAVGDSCAAAVMACHNDPDVIKNIILINPQSLSKLNLPPNHNTKLLKFMIDMPILGTFIYNMLTSKDNYRKLFREEYFYDNSAVTEDMIAAYAEASHIPDHNAKYSFSSYIGRYINANIVHALKEIDHSIYILYGKGKNDIEGVTDIYLSYNSAIEKFGIDKASHLPHMENPDEVLKQLEILL